MTRTRRSLLRTVSTATVAAVATGTVTAQSNGDTESTDIVERAAIRTTTQTCAGGELRPVSTDESFPVSDDTVRFSGSMETPNPCHRAVIESIDREGETLVVTVASEWPDDVGGCIMCIGRIGFDGIVELSDPEPIDSVEVRTVDPWA